MISLVPCKDRTRIYVMIFMTSYIMTLLWNQGGCDPGSYLMPHPMRGGGGSSNAYLIVLVIGIIEKEVNVEHNKQDS